MNYRFYNIFCYWLFILYILDLKKQNISICSYNINFSDINLKAIYIFIILFYIVKILLVKNTMASIDHTFSINIFILSLSSW